MEHKTVCLPGGTVHYWICKNERPGAKCLLFTHGLTADHTMFEKQLAHFGATCTLITWDVPLHGLSQPYQGFSYKETAQAMHSILQQEQISRAVLVGMSMGGYPSQEFACRYPEQTEGFVALDTTPFGTGYYSRADLWWLKQVSPMARWFPGGLLRKSMARSVSQKSDSYQIMMEILGRSTKQQIVRQMEIAYGELARENRDITLSCPVLLLLGDHDRTGKVRQYNEEWAKKAGYPLHIIKNAAHFSNSDNARQANEEIEAFLQSL